MSTFYPETMTCQNCGASSEQQCLNSTNQFGSMDLDTRPPEMERSTLSVQIQVCPNCHYCAADISKAVADTSGSVSSKAYQDQFNKAEYPSLANAYLCRALIEESANQLDQAGWMTLKAAWVCDDAENIASAKKCRIQAVKLFRKALSAGQEFAHQPGADDVMLVDLLRRSGQFGEASEQIAIGLSKEPVEIIQKILAFERDLVARGDVECYTLAKVPGVG